MPERGAWLDIEFDHKELVYARIDRRRKMLVTVLLKALGYTEEQLLENFYKAERVKLDGKRVFKKVTPELLVGQRCSCEVKGPDGKVLMRRDRKFTRAVGAQNYGEASSIGFRWTSSDLIRDDAVKRVAPSDMVDEKTGEVVHRSATRSSPRRIWTT